MKRAIIWLLVLVGAAMFSLVITVGVLVFLPDDPPPNDAWMLPVMKNVSGANPLAEFQKWLDHHHLPDSEPEWQRLSSTFSDADAKVIMGKYHEVIDRFAAFTETDPSAWSWWWEGKRASFVGSSDDVSKLSTVSTLVQRLAHLRADQKRPLDAADMAKRLIKAGRDLQKADGGVLLHMIGTNCVVKGLYCFKWIAQNGGGSDEDWKGWQTFLSQMEPEPSDMAASFRFDYFRFKQTVEDITHDTSNEPEMTKRGRRAFVKPNATLNLYQEVMGPLMKALPADDWPATERELTKVESRIAEMKSNRISFFFSGNPMGKFLAVWISPNCRGAVRNDYNTRALMRCVICEIAFWRHGGGKAMNIPDKLAALVPDYLSQVPTDPFDKQPLRWNPAKSIVYSVGPDMKDDGGEINEAHLSKGKDVGQTLWQSTTNSH